MLSLHKIAIDVGAVPLLAFDRLDIAAGQIVSLLGASGSGKSTLLKAIAGLGDPGVRFRGAIRIRGRALEHLPAHRRGLGYVDQQPVLLPHLNVQQNLAFGLRGARAHRHGHLKAALATAGLSAFAQADVATLSGGQGARVALMRTLVSQPCALLLDEPFAALDPELRIAMRDFVFAQVRALGLPTLLVTHDREDAIAARGPVFTLENKTLLAQTLGHV